MCRKSFLFSLLLLPFTAVCRAAPLLLASAASRSPVTLGRPTVTQLGENNKPTKKPKNQKKKKNLENVATATDFLRLSLFLLHSSSSSSKPKPKEPENNIALEMSSYITFVLILSVMCVWWWYRRVRKQTLIFSFLATLSYYYLRQQCLVVQVVEVVVV